MGKVKFQRDVSPIREIRFGNTFSRNTTADVLARVHTILYTSRRANFAYSECRTTSGSRPINLDSFVDFLEDTDENVKKNNNIGCGRTKANLV